MAIRVTCNSCHTRFNVSDKFAGKEGPCPKCKKTIRIPDLTEEVVIHAPEGAGPKDSTGRPVLKPIRRKETVLSSVQWTLIAVSIIGFLLAALMLRMMYEGDTSKFPPWLMIVAAIAIAPPLVYVAYGMLRDQELGSFNKVDLRNRVLVCSLLYAALWFAMPLACVAFNDKYEMSTWLTALIPMLGIGGAIGMLSFELDYILGLVHYGMYLTICLLGRLLAGIGFLPGMNLETGKSPTPNAPEVLQSAYEATQPFVTLAVSWFSA